MALTKINDRSGYSVDLSNYLTGVSQADLPAGTVLNHDHMTCGTDQTIQSSSSVNTLYTLNYTPVSSNSIIIITCSGTVLKYNTSTSVGMQGAIYRDDALISSGDDWIGNYGTFSNEYMSALNVRAFDTSHTAGTQYTYRLKVRTSSGSRFYIYSNNSSLDIIEIAG